ncbi:hypothetical protein DL771_009674 [Monosporascus sp. 5C6A]|nr:hypothetical protein DL771_009674 [Monosporascus sp. 5C6A]
MSKQCVFATAMPIECARAVSFGTDSAFDDPRRHRRWVEEAEDVYENKPRPSVAYQQRRLHRSKRRRREIEGEEVDSFSLLNIRSVQDQNKHAPMMLRWFHAPDLFRRFAAESPAQFAGDEGATYVDFVHIAGDEDHVSLYMTAEYIPLNNVPPQPPQVVAHDILLETLEKRLLDEKVLLQTLDGLVLSPDRQDLLLSLRALATAKMIYKMLPGATVDLGVTSKPISNLPWVRHFLRVRKFRHPAF